MSGRTHRGRPTRLLVVALSAIVAAVFTPVAAQASPEHPLAVTFTFDDGVADQLGARALLEQYGMRGTFYINSALIGADGYMTRNDLETIAAAGHEIGGHTVSHQDLTVLGADEMNRQICQDRDTLLTWGFPVSSLAYPFAEYNDAVKAAVTACGYDNARAVGDLWSPSSCADCDAAETVPPVDRLAVRTPDDVESTWTLADLQAVITNAEVTGGWVPFNIHHLCEGAGCPLESVSPAVLEQFLAWLQPRTTEGTTVTTVAQAIGATVHPAVAPTPPPAPGAPGVNYVNNPSLEDPATGDLPTCWQNAGYGTNDAAYARVADAHSGAWGSQITITTLTDGDAKIVPTFDLGACSLQVTEGRSYESSVWYKSTAPVFLTLYRRNGVGRWEYWTQSPRFAPQAGWAQATWVAPPVPAGTAAVGFGLTLDGIGTLVTDDYGFADVPRFPAPAPAGVNALKNPSLEVAGGEELPQCWEGTGFGENTVAWSRVTDAYEGTYAARLDITEWNDGDAKLVPAWDASNCAPTVTPGASYTLEVAYKSTAPVFFTLYRLGEDGVWSWWTQTTPIAAATDYTVASYVTPAVPDGTVAVSWGLTLGGNGSLTTDAYSMVANP